jgi:hypothetical protein
VQTFFIKFKKTAQKTQKQRFRFRFSIACLPTATGLLILRLMGT